MIATKSIALSNPDFKPQTNGGQRLGLTIGLVGLGILFLASVGLSLPPSGWLLATALTAITAGTAVYAWATYRHHPEGIKNNYNFFRPLTYRGTVAYVLGVVLTGFYILLYWFPQYLGLGQDGGLNWGLVAFFDPLSQLLKGQPASQWFVYGTLYTIAILALGFKFILKYRHNRYQLFRTISVMFFQLAFAFMLPELLIALNQPYNNFVNMWPLNYYFFDGWHINEMLHSGNWGLFMLLFGLAMIFIISPILTFKYGKRWYCSWVCGCGGLAETAGDPFRHQSDNSLKAWKFERVSIHLVTVFATVMTIGILHSYLSANGDVWLNQSTFTWGVVLLLGLIGALIAWWKRDYFNKDARTIILSVLAAMVGATLINALATPGKILFVDAQLMRQYYGFLIGAAFSGVVGVGFYPLLGNRVWCRFGCPMAAILGFQQRVFSKFRITVNGGQCISCGNCSVYCEMGIDVRAYAQKGQNVVRSSCVGCGICSAVCPRGVLKLENGPNTGKSRMTEPAVVMGHHDEVDLLSTLQTKI